MEQREVRSPEDTQAGPVPGQLVGSAPGSCALRFEELIDYLLHPGYSARKGPGQLQEIVKPALKDPVRLMPDCDASFPPIE